jgi:predicted metal-binding membrane protein
MAWLGEDGLIRPSSIESDRPNKSLKAGWRYAKLAFSSAGGLAAIVLVLAWSYLGWMDWGMRHMEIGARMWIMPQMVGWNAADLALVFVMWAVMMAAMMLPSAVPAIFLVASMTASATAHNQRVGLAGAFISGYLLAWSIFSIAAALFHWGLLETELVTPMMESASLALSATVLGAAGIYQLTPLKNACLHQCQSPFNLIMEIAAFPGRALRVGLRYGLYCVGCCWALMGLLLVGGVMNLPWIMIIAAYVAIEKILPKTKFLSQIVGVTLCCAGLWIAIGQIG